jgi:cobalamin biosynthesis protein CobD/CbiB
MNLFALLAALGLEHWRPERPGRPRRTAGDWLAWLLENLNAGGEQHGALAWTLGALAPALVVAGLWGVLDDVWQPLAWVFSVVALYFCLGFKVASFRAASVMRALRDADTAMARELLAEWRPGILAGADESALIRQTLEETLRQSMIRLFGVLFWFLVLGPAGAVLYLLTRLARDRWHGEAAFARFAGLVAGWLDWLPVRIVAFSFAIVGNFQDALEAWRAQARGWGDEHDGILLAAAAGALGLQLGGVINLPAGELDRPVLGPDDAHGGPPGLESLDAVVALIWRATLLWVAVLGLLWLGSM